MSANFVERVIDFTKNRKEWISAISMDWLVV